MQWFAGVKGPRGKRAAQWTPIDLGLFMRKQKLNSAIICRYDLCLIRFTFARHARQAKQNVSHPEHRGNGSRTSLPFWRCVEVAFPRMGSASRENRPKTGLAQDARNLRAFIPLNFNLAIFDRAPGATSFLHCLGQLFFFRQTDPDKTFDYGYRLATSSGLLPDNIDAPPILRRRRPFDSGPRINGRILGAWGKAIAGQVSKGIMAKLLCAVRGNAFGAAHGFAHRPYHFSRRRGNEIQAHEKSFVAFFLSRTTSLAFRIHLRGRRQASNFQRFLVASIAQLDRASDYGSEGCRFNSYWVHQFDNQRLAHGFCPPSLRHAFSLLSHFLNRPEWSGEHFGAALGI